MFKRILFVILLSLYCGINVVAQGTATEKAKELPFMPVINGTFRAFYRQSTVSDQSRFEVANARLSLSGNVMEWLKYYTQVEYDNLGKIKILDAYATIIPTNGLKIMAGQMRVPLCVEATRSPFAYYFADVALVTKFGNLRSVGVKAGYTIPELPWYFEGGVFNASDMSDHSTWNSALTYSIKTNYTAKCGLKPEIGFMSRVPGGEGVGVRVNQYDASLSWTCGRFFTEVEYLYRTYADGAHPDSYAYNFFVDYSIPVKWRMADQVSFQARFDGISDASEGKKNAEGELDTNIDARRRVTIGTTFSSKIGNLSTHFRLNFEQYFYGHTSPRPSTADNNQIVAGVMVHF